MEIRITRRIRGRDEVEKALAKYGTRERVEEVARADPDSDANRWLLSLQLADEDPSTLDEWSDSTEVWELEPDDIRLLTATRMELLDKVMQMDHTSISDLQRAVKRDYKRVYEDIQILERLHTVETRKEGGRRIVRPVGQILHIAIGRLASTPMT